MKLGAVSFDISNLPPKKEDWYNQVIAIVLDLLKQQCEIIVFPEYFLLSIAVYANTKHENEQLTFAYENIWRDFIPRLMKNLRGTKHFIVLGSGPYMEVLKSKSFFYNRSPVLIDGHIDSYDKIYLTPWESHFSAGKEIKIFEYQGYKICPLICFDVEHPHISSLLKDQEIDFILVPSTTSNRYGSERVLRTASARSIELGACVLVVPLIGDCDFSTLIDHNEGRQGFFLPAQDCVKGELQQFSDYRMKSIDIKVYRLQEEMIKMVKEKNFETKPFHANDPKIELKYVNLNQ